MSRPARTPRRLLISSYGEELVEVPPAALGQLNWGNIRDEAYGSLVLMTVDRPDERAADFGSQLRILASRWWLIVAIVGVATGLTYAYYAHKPKAYESSTTIFVQPPNASGLLSGLTGGNALANVAVAVDSDRNTLDQATLLQSRGVAAQVALRLGYHGNLDALRSKITVVPRTGEDFVTVTATDADPEYAARLANAYAGSFVASRTQGLRSQLQTQQALYQKQLASLPPTRSNAAQRQTLTDQIRELTAITTTATGGAEQVDRAVPPASPSYPHPARSAVFAFLLSLLAAIFLANVLERADRRIKDDADIEPLYGAPVIGLVPEVKQPVPSDGTAEHIPHELVEPFRVVRTNVGMQTLDKPIKTLLVTSAVTGEGKSMTSRNLALAYRESGLTVALVDADLRRPSVARSLGAESGSGLLDVLHGDASWRDRAVRVGPGGDSPNGHVDYEIAGGLINVLGANRSVPNPPGLLGSLRMRSLLSELAEDHDIVIVDTPPLVGVSDALALIPSVDAVLLVARLGVVSRRAAEHGRDVLGRVPGATVVGVVANGLRSGPLTGSYYGYGQYAQDHGKPRGRVRRLSVSIR